MAEFGARSFGSTLMLACGEANIVSTQRGSSDITDPMGFMANLADKRLILNPTHTRMKRWEMAEKRRQFSIDGRTVVSVWNPDNKDPRTALPWQAYRNGAAISDQIVSRSGDSFSCVSGNGGGAGGTEGETIVSETFSLSEVSGYWTTVTAAASSAPCPTPGNATNATDPDMPDPATGDNPIDP